MPRSRSKAPSRSGGSECQRKKRCRCSWRRCIRQIHEREEGRGRVCRDGQRRSAAQAELAKVLREEKDPEIRASVALALRGLGQAPATSERSLLDGTRSDDPEVRRGALLALSSPATAAQQRLPTFAKALEDESPQVASRRPRCWRSLRPRHRRRLRHSSLPSTMNRRR
jgi:hypothetical protein